MEKKKLEQREGPGGKGVQASGLWGEIIRQNDLNWNQEGQRSQMALHGRWRLNLPYGTVCNQCQSTAGV